MNTENKEQIQEVQTNYLTLDEAAKMLHISDDNVLIAAAERRIPLYGLLNRIVSLVKCKPIEGSHDYEKIKTEIEFVSFFKLPNEAVADLINQGKTDFIVGFWDENEEVLSLFADKKSLPVIKKIFLRKSDVESLNTNGLNQTTVKDTSEPDGIGPIKARNLRRLVAAILDVVVREDGTVKNYASQNQLKLAIVEKYNKITGLTERTLDGEFAECNKLLKAALEEDSLK